jgi:hypothetical protein
MRTVGPRPQSWSSLAANVYSHLDNERSEAAKAAQAKHEKWQEDLMRPWGLVRSTRAAQPADWWSRQGAKK